MLETPIIVGGNVILRQPKLSDIDDRFAIGRHNEFVHMCGGEPLSNPEYPDRTYWVNWYENIQNRVNNGEYTWIIEVDNHCVGEAGFHKISEEDNSAVYRIGIFNHEFHSKGIGTEVTKLLLKFGFENMKWHRIELRVLDYNHRGIRCYEKCGFVKDGILRENAYINGKYHSDIVMSILDYEYKKIYNV